jgi:hypothetical protein
MDELRVEIWDLLYRAEEPKSIGDITECIDQDEATVRAAVEHEWFTIMDDLVSISQPAPE